MSNLIQTAHASRKKPGRYRLYKGNLTRGERVFHACNDCFMFLLMLMFLIPFWSVFAMSFVSEAEAARRGSFILFPESFDLTAYRVLLSGGSAVWRAYGNTLFVVIVGTAVNLLLTVMLAYGLSKKGLPGRSGLTLMIFVTMLFSGGLIPSFLLNKYLGLVDSRWALILPGAISAWNTFIMRNFFAELPESLEEAAHIDGASTVRVLFSIVLPISLPSIMTIGLFYAVGHWNAWFSAAIYINSKPKLPVQNILRNMVAAASSSDVNSEAVNSTMQKPPAETMKSAMIVVTTLPILFVYPFIQKYFVKGVLVGSVKG